MPGRLDQFVGHATHGGDGRNELALRTRGSDNFHDLSDAGRVAHRRSAKLHHSNWLFEIAPVFFCKPVFLCKRVMWYEVPALEASTHGAVCHRRCHKRGNRTVDRVWAGTSLEDRT